MYSADRSDRAFAGYRHATRRADEIGTRLMYEGMSEGLRAKLRRTVAHWRRVADKFWQEAWS